MNVKQLHNALKTALERGIDPNTEVVFGDDGDWRVITTLHDPSDITEWMGGNVYADPDDADLAYIWFTLESDSFADPRITHCHTIEHQREQEVMGLPKVDAPKLTVTMQVSDTQHDGAFNIPIVQEKFLDSMGQEMVQRAIEFTEEHAVEIKYCHVEVETP